MGKALIKGQTIKCMAEHLYKLILGWPLTINDLKVADEELYSHLMGLNDLGADVDKLHLDFTLTEDISGSRRTVELVPNGSSISVTEENLPQYFEACIKYRFLGQCEFQLNQLLLGFFDVIPPPLVSVFDFQELGLLMSGHAPSFSRPPTTEWLPQRGRIITSYEMTGCSSQAKSISVASISSNASSAPGALEQAIIDNGKRTSLHINQRHPAYLIHRDLLIGKGSYGQVCIASYKTGERKRFACKCVMLRSDPKHTAKLQKETNVLREVMEHDNVIRLFDVLCVDNELFIITELGRGGDLLDLLMTHPKQGVTEAYAGELQFYAYWSARNM